MKLNKSSALIVVTLLVVSVVVWAQGKRAEDSMENQIRKATFNYYLGQVLGEQEEFFKSIRVPFVVTLDGKYITRDETYLKEMIAAIHKKNAAAKLSPEDRGVIVKNMIGNIDDSQVQFVGAGTAIITFLIQHNDKTMADRFCSLALHREGTEKPEWKVIQEITDSKPVPADYLK